MVKLDYGGHHYVRLKIETQPKFQHYQPMEMEQKTFLRIQRISASSTAASTIGGGGGSITKLTCVQCNNRYKNPNHLKRHMLYECGQEPKMMCQYCQSKFKRPDSLRRHMLQSCPNKNLFATEMYK